MESHPRVIVWDLDGTLWSPEMYQLWGGGAPFAALNDGEHVVDRSGTKVELLADARAILNKLRGAEFEHIKLAIASTCDEPKWAAECLAKICVENRALKDHFHDDVVEIYKASSKEVHLKAIAKKSSCELHDMIFFDNQRDNIAVAKRMGVFSVYTPDGVTNGIFEDAMARFSLGEHKRRKY